MKWFHNILFAATIVFGVSSAGGILVYATGSGLYETPDSEAFVSQDFFRALKPGKKIDLGAKAYPQDRTVMLFVGDIMLGRYVETLMDANGSQYPFEHIEPLLASRDFVFGNLEGPIVYDHAQTPNFSTSFSFSEDKADVLADNHFDAVSLANNHTLDQGALGYENTHEILDANGIQYSGHATKMGQEFVLSTDVGNENVNFISFNTTFPTNDEDEAVKTVKSIAQSSQDLIIVNVHWGTEYELTSNASQQEFAHRLIDAGADLIVGHHPHVVEEVERYEGKLIFYSLGNFIFDQYFSGDVQEGLAVSIALEPDRMLFRLYPLQSSRSQVRLMDPEAVPVWLYDLAARSDSELFEQVSQGLIEVGR